MGTAPFDPHDLARFVTAQDEVLPQVCAELRAGRKATHWIWFVFPQFAGLGQSEMSRTYGIRSREEAAAYLAHPALSPRLEECAALVLAVPGASAERILGSINATKFRSSMALFAAVSAAGSVYHAALARFFGSSDALTLERLGGP